MSEGISEEECRTIESKGIYSVPISYLSILPPEKFPVKLAFYRLPSGRFAISRSIYTGKDYSGRDGNYFSHTIVFSTLPVGFVPILTFFSNFWEDRYECSGNNMLPPLQLDLEKLRSNRCILIRKLRSLLLQKRELAQIFMEKVYNIVGENNKGSILIIDEMKNIPYWILLVYECLPQKLLTELSFSTYDNEDVGSFNIIGNPFEKKATSYNTFNFQEDRIEYCFKSDYVSFAINSLLSFPDKLKRFLTDVSDLVETPRDLEYFYKIYKGEIHSILIVSLQGRIRKLVEKQLLVLPPDEAQNVLDFNFRNSPNKEKAYEYFRELFRKEGREDLWAHLLRLMLNSIVNDEDKLEFLARESREIPSVPPFADIIKENFPFHFNWWKNTELAMKAYEVLVGFNICVPRELESLYLLERKLHRLSDEKLVSLARELLKEKHLPKEKRERLINGLLYRKHVWEDKKLGNIMFLFSEDEKRKLLNVLDCKSILSRVTEISENQEIRSWLKIIPYNCLKDFMNSELCSERKLVQIKSSLPFSKKLRLKIDSYFYKKEFPSSFGVKNKKGKIVEDRKSESICRKDDEKELQK
jgi:hypothetical protein